MVTENFRAPQALAELGFLVASFDGRGTAAPGQGVYRGHLSQIGAGGH